MPWFWASGWTRAHSPGWTGGFCISHTSTNPTRFPSGVKTARVRSTAKLREVEKLAKLFPKLEIVYFDDQPSAFRDAESMPGNVQMFRVVARNDDDTSDED